MAAGSLSETSHLSPTGTDVDVGTCCRSDGFLSDRLPGDGDDFVGLLHMSLSGG